MKQKVNKVCVGAIRYEVVDEADLRSKEGHELDGQIDHAVGLIRLREGLCPDAKRQVLWHEIVHGIVTNYRLRLKEDDIDRMAVGIVQVLRDNEWLGAK